MWAKWSPGSVGRNLKAILECVPKQPTYLANCYHPVAVVPLDKASYEAHVEKVAKVLGREDYMQSEDQEDYNSTARAVLRAIGLTAKGK